MAYPSRCPEVYGICASGEKSGSRPVEFIVFSWRGPWYGPASPYFDQDTIREVKGGQGECASPEMPKEPRVLIRTKRIVKHDDHRPSEISQASTQASK